jgi:hypothetical protein
LLLLPSSTPFFSLLIRLLFSLRSTLLRLLLFGLKLPRSLGTLLSEL